MSSGMQTKEESYITDTSSTQSGPTGSDENGLGDSVGQKSPSKPPSPQMKSPLPPEKPTPASRRHRPDHEAPKITRSIRKPLVTQTEAAEQTKISSAFVILEKMARSAVATQGSKLLRKMSLEKSVPSAPSTPAASPQTQQQLCDAGQGCSYTVGKDRAEAGGSANQANPPRPSRQESCFEGYWKLTLSQNWDVFLKEAGVSFLLRKLSRDLTTYERITRHGDLWHVEMLSPLKNFDSKFYLDEEFEEENFDGRKVKATAYLNKTGTVMTIVQTALEKDGLQLTIIRRLLQSDEMLLTVTINSELGRGVEAKSYFIRIAEET